jgi:pimeloyl-ACP methyl ester carboxylesterase
MSPQCRVIKIVTPRRYVLNGLWFGSRHPQKALIFVHGLTATAFSNHEFLVPLADDQTAVITFSNRGHDKIAKVKKLDQRKKKGYSSQLIGEAHEVFTDCVDDLQGAVNFLREQGIAQIFLVGHSTGCQKSVYYLSRPGKQQFVDGMILLCPISDYAAALKFDSHEQLSAAEKAARRLSSAGRPHQLLPLDLWPAFHDAQRFLSLYTPDSPEEIFSYAQPEKSPKTLTKLKIPTLIVFAGQDEYRDRPTEKIAAWFKNHLPAPDLTIKIISDALHSFQHHEPQVVKAIASWLDGR